MKQWDQAREEASLLFEHTLLLLAIIDERKDAARPSFERTPWRSL